MDVSLVSGWMPLSLLSAAVLSAAASVAFYRRRWKGLRGPLTVDVVSLTISVVAFGVVDPWRYRCPISGVVLRRIDSRGVRCGVGVPPADSWWGLAPSIWRGARRRRAPRQTSCTRTSRIFLAALLTTRSHAGMGAWFDVGRGDRGPRHAAERLSQAARDAGTDVTTVVRPRRSFLRLLATPLPARRTGSARQSKSSN